MKNFFKKHDLIKASGILVLITVLLTWIIPYGYYSGTEMTVDEITRVGLTNFMQYGLLGMYYFTVLITFLFVLGGFYQVLSKTNRYNILITRICKKLKGKEIPFVVIISFVLAALCSISSEYFPLIVFIPFIITILNKLKVDRISAFATTFGALLVGTFGSTYSDKVVGYINTTFATTTSTYLVVKIILFFSAFILLNIFTTLRLKKTIKKGSNEEYDKFALPELNKDNKNVKLWPSITCLVLAILAIILAYLPWTAWEVTVFTDITTWVNELSLFGVPIISYVFGEFAAFGAWDIFTVQFVMLTAILIIKIFGKKSFDDIIDSMGEGFKKIAPVVIVLLLVYMTLEFAVMYPILPVIVDWVATLSDGFNAFLSFISAFIVSIFGVEMQYVMNLAGTYFASEFADNVNVLAIIFQTAFGFASFFVPSSAILMIGLSYLDMPYKDWLKFIWKFLVALLLIIAVIILIICLI